MKGKSAKGKARKRIQLEKAVFQALSNTSGNSLQYSDLLFLVNSFSQWNTAKGSLTQVMRKHIAAGFLILEKRTIDGNKSYTWTLAEGVSCGEFYLHGNIAKET